MVITVNFERDLLLTTKDVFIFAYIEKAFQVFGHINNFCYANLLSRKENLIRHLDYPFKVFYCHLQP